MKAIVLIVVFFFAGQLHAQEDTTVYDIVDQEAQFPGGMQQMMRWFIDQDIKFEEEYLNGTCSSRITIEFIVEKDGSISTIKSLNTCALSQENAITIMQASPSWSPAILNSKKVRSHYLFPIRICFTDQ